MTSELANRLMNADSPESFVREHKAAGPETLAALKAEVDRLVVHDLDLAEGLTARLEQLAGVLGDGVSKAFAEASRASVLNHKGQYKEAEALYETALACISEAGIKVQAAIIQKQQAGVFNHLGRYQKALQTARAARRVLARSEPLQLAQLETNVGNIYYRLDRYKKALEHYDRARELFAQAGDDNMRAIVDFGRSNILTELDRPDEAIALLERAAATWDRTGLSARAAQARFHIAYIHFLRGHYNTALTSYYQTRDQLTGLGSLELIAWCNLEIAEILLALNAFDDAAESAANARASFEQIGMPYDSAKASLVHALALAGAGQLDQAETELLEARENFARNSNSTFAALTDSYLAEIALRRGDPVEGRNRASAALRVFARQGLPLRSAHARLLAARASYLAGDRSGSRRQARAALGRIEGMFAPSVAFQCYNLLGRIERDRNRHGFALDYFRKSVETIERMRGGIGADELKTTFLRDKTEAYEDAISACLDEGGDQALEDAFRLVESSKSRALADLLARYVRDESAETERTGGVESSTRARLSKLIEDLNWYSSHANLEDEKGDQRTATTADRYRRAVVKCERQIAQLFRRLEVSDSSFAEIHRMKAASATDLRDSLDPGETAIEYFITGNQVSAFVATTRGVKVARGIAARRDVEHSLQSLRFQIEKFNYGARYVDAHFGQLRRAADEHLSRLYEAVFEPVAQMIEGDRLVIIPHGALHYVPFHALRDRSGYLVDRFEISYAPSAAVLRLCRARRARLDGSRSTGRMVALGVAESGTPNIEDEIEALGAIFPDALKLTGADATRDNLLKVAPEARFLHLASHGYFRRDNPMFSFLKLADSRLNFYSLLDLKINAELVTLSACHTGVNMVFPGDELHGLMRGFLYAGAPSLVTSLWAVSDRSTAELMGEMYKHLHAGANKRAALHQAQLAIKDAYGHPYYWAPFVLMGDPK